MGQVLHGCATTTEAVRRAIQHSQESLRALARRYGINQKTVAKWKKPQFGCRSADRARKKPKSTVLSVEEEAIDRRLPPAYAAAARRLPLRAAADDPASDALIAASLPATPWHQPTAGCRRRQARRRRSSSPIRSASSTSTSPKCGRRKASSTCSSRSTAPRSSPSSSLVEKANRVTASAFLDALDQSRSLQDPHGPDRQRHPVHACRRATPNGPDRAVFDAHVRHALPRERNRTSLTKIKHPWTNGQVERMNRTIKEATVKRYHYEDHQQLRRTPRRLRRRLQFRPTAQDPQRPHAIRVHLQMLDNTARTFHTQPAPSNAGTKHLNRACDPQRSGVSCPSNQPVQLAQNRLDFTADASNAWGRLGIPICARVLPPRRPCCRCGVVLVTAHAVSSTGVQDGEVEQRTSDGSFCGLATRRRRRDPPGRDESRSCCKTRCKPSGSKSDARGSIEAGHAGLAQGRGRPRQKPRSFSRWPRGDRRRRHCACRFKGSFEVGMGAPPDIAPMGVAAHLAVARVLPRSGSKQAQIVEMLSNGQGATLPELEAAMDWLPHTTRAALSGLRKRGFAVERVHVEGQRSLYRIAASPAGSSA